jgi:DNA-binding MarR family transcriptional regulator
LGALWRLSSADGASPGELAAAEKVSPPSMNRTVNSLEEAGYVRREPSPDDARRVLVRLTPEGRDLLAETARLRAEWFSAQLSRLPAHERAQLLAVTEILRKLADS